MREYKLTAPDIDELLRCFDRSYMNPSRPSEALSEAMEPLFDALHDLAPRKKNNEAKSIRVMIPRGSIDDYTSYEDMLEWGEVENREEYEKRWTEEYPDPVIWYELVTWESFDREGRLAYRGIRFGNKIIVSSSMNADHTFDDRRPAYEEEAAVALCPLMTMAAQNSMRKLAEGSYNALVESSLPYPFRAGVIRRSVLWEKAPGQKEYDMDGISEEALNNFIQLLQSGVNDPAKIGRMKSMTANDFFHACATGYQACGYEGTELPWVEQYFLHADGRDEGLSGRGYGLNAGPGIDFDDVSAWDQWYFHREQRGGHPWEVCRGGNSTHVSLYVSHDEHEIGYLYRSGQISADEYKQRKEKAGYYFIVAGLHRAAEAVYFYTALSDAGFPVIISDAEEILARFEGTDYVGIVPHHVPTRYCESLFPASYGNVIDFMHVYDEEMAEFGDAVEWLPEEEAELIKR
ncbi:MAG: hypothetical protein IJ130_14400 [Solobacterium sp.]|nr:hypothetical protein [Solobacterium sp.]